MVTISRDQLIQNFNQAAGDDSALSEDEFKTNKELLFNDPEVKSTIENTFAENPGKPISSATFRQKINQLYGEVRYVDTTPDPEPALTIGALETTSRSEIVTPPKTEVLPRTRLKYKFSSRELDNFERKGLDIKLRMLHDQAVQRSEDPDRDGLNGRLSFEITVDANLKGRLTRTAEDNTLTSQSFLSNVSASIEQFSFTRPGVISYSCFFETHTSDTIPPSNPSASYAPARDPEPEVVLLPSHENEKDRPRSSEEEGIEKLKRGFFSKMEQSLESSIVDPLAAALEHQSVTITLKFGKTPEIAVGKISVVQHSIFSEALQNKRRREEEEDRARLAQGLPPRARREMKDTIEDEIEARLMSWVREYKLPEGTNDYEITFKFQKDPFPFLKPI